MGPANSEQIEAERLLLICYGFYKTVSPYNDGVQGTFEKRDGVESASPGASDDANCVWRRVCCRTPQ